MKQFFKIILSTTLLVISCSSFADTAGNFYVQALGGMAWSKADGLDSKDLSADGASVSSGISTADNSPLYGVAAGYTFANLPIRVELQALHINQQTFKFGTLYTDPDEENYHEIDKLSVSSNVYLANVYYTWSLQSNFKPFVGAGAGVAQNTISGKFNSDTEVLNGSWKDNNRTNLAYDVTAGIGYHIMPHLDISLAYQYLSLGKITSSDTYYANDGSSGPQTLSARNVHLNNALLGVAYTF